MEAASAIDTSSSAWQTLCWSIVTNGPLAVSALVAQLLERTLIAGDVASVVDPSAAQPVSVREPFPSAGTGGEGWPMPFAALDPRERVGVIIFVVLGLGALCLATAVGHRQVYAGVGLSQQNAFALRITLGFAGLILLVAAAIGQLAS
jgi:hypothetical protein